MPSADASGRVRKLHAQRLVNGEVGDVHIIEGV
jgi:hypothetical protein